MFTRVTLDRLYVGSVYKILFVGLACSMLPLCLVFGVFAVFGFNTVTWNGQAVHGWSGLFLSPLIAAMVTGLFTLFVGTACIAGLWLFSKFRSLSLWGKNVVHHSQDAA